MEKYKHIDFRDQISRNKYKSFFLMAVIFAVFILFGYVISLAMGQGYFFIIMIVAIIFSLSYILISFYKSDKIAIASVGAKKANRNDYKQYYNIVEGLTLASGMPMPELYIMDSPQINAFASGRDPQHAVICVTEGALEKLEKRELEGVLAHELGHIASYDMRYMTLVAVMVGMIAIVSQIFLRSLFFRGGNDKDKIIFIIIGIAMAILAPIVVWLVQMAISRKREFTADASAVKFTRYPDGLIRAFKKIQADNAPAEKKVSKAVAPLFFSNPFRVSQAHSDSPKRGRTKGLGNTHPPLEKRIQMLERM